MRVDLHGSIKEEVSIKVVSKEGWSQHSLGYADKVGQGERVSHTKLAAELLVVSIHLSLRQCAATFLGLKGPLKPAQTNQCKMFTFPRHC